MTPRRKSTPSPIEPKAFSISEIDAGIHKLRRRIDEVRGLSSGETRHDDARVKTIQSNIRETIREVFGGSSPEFLEHGYHHIWHGRYNTRDGDWQLQEKFVAGVPQTISMLEGLVERLEEKRGDIANAATSASLALAATSVTDTRRVFVVHGHDEKAQQTIARFLEKLELEPVILSERPNEGRTVIEKFEANADVCFAIVLLTADDVGYPRDLPDEARLRARQNVILELGYFVGRLSRARVCALCKGSLELPSDIHGVAYITMDETDGWKLRLARELKQGGINVDLNLAV